MEGKTLQLFCNLAFSFLTLGVIKSKLSKWELIAFFLIWLCHVLSRNKRVSRKDRNMSRFIHCEYGKYEHNAEPVFLFSPRQLLNLITETNNYNLPRQFFFLPFGNVNA